MSQLHVLRKLVLLQLTAVLLMSTACSGVSLPNQPPSSQGTDNGVLSWPFDAGISGWMIENGYNWNTGNGGLDHGCSTTGSTCYEQYSFDFQLGGSSGNTIGQNVLSPASGQLVDFGSAAPGDGSSGYCASIGIDGYSGYHILICHLQSETPDRVVTRGDVIGQVASGQYGDHIHMTLYYLDPNVGNDNTANATKRKAIPFSDPWTIAGCAYEANGGVNQWHGTLVPCANSSVSAPQPTPTSTPSPVPPPTPTSSPLAACRAITGFANAGSAAAVAAQFFSQPAVPFPSTSIGYVKRTFDDPSVDQPGMVYHFEIIAACSPATTPNALRSYFASTMPTDGWTQSTTFPYGGNYSSSCGDPYCWLWGAFASDVNHFASLENVGRVGTVTTYEIRLGVEAPPS